MIDMEYRKWTLVKLTATIHFDGDEEEETFTFNLPTTIDDEGPYDIESVITKGIEEHMLNIHDSYNSHTKN